ncbi:MAG: ABC-F family ATP-binding cassette domain-containing protein [Solirubrobacterales bacterium]
MNLLAMEHVVKGFGLKQLLRDVSFGIEEGEKIGLLGKNGSGKSTFLKLAAGLDEPDGGTIAWSKNLRIEYLPQNPAYDPNATVIETVLTGDTPAMRVLKRYHAVMRELDFRPDDRSLHKEMTHLSQELDAMHAWSLESEAQTVLTRLGITGFDERMAVLSGGQRKRVALAAALMNPADLLILDEPTNHLDNLAIDWLEKHLRSFTGALLMVTHDRYFLQRVANRIAEIENGQMYSYPGNYAVYLERKLEREEMAAASEKKRESVLRKELAWVQKGPRARTTKQKARIDRYENLVEEHQTNRTDTAVVQMASTASRLGKKTIIVENVSHGYGQDSLVSGYSTILAQDERLGIVGPNGIGKTTLLKLIMGEITPEQGTVDIGPTVKIGYFPQESNDLPESMRVIDYIREAGEYLQAGKRNLSASQMLETFLFPSAAQWNLIANLSGGERRRLHLLRILMGAPNVLLFDEPGNDLDIETLTILEDYLDDFPGAVVAVSHDRFFLDRIADRILAFQSQGRTKEYPGNYTDYAAFAAAEVSEKTVPVREDKSVDPGRNQEKEKAKPLKFTFNEQREYEEIDSRVEAAEHELQAFREAIEQSASDYQRLQELLAEREAAEHRLDELLERWTYLNELAETIEKQKAEKDAR